MQNYTEALRTLRAVHARTSTVPEPSADDMRTGMRDLFADYAQQALDSGDRFGHEIWLRAASIASGYVPRQSTRTPGTP